MARRYNVWVSIEEYDSDEDNHEDLSMPDKLFASDRLEDAAAFVRRLPGWENDGCSAAHPDAVRTYIEAVGR